MRIRNIPITPEVEAVLRASTWPTPGALALPAGRLDPKLYQAVNKVLVALGGKWNRSQGVHLFAGDVAADLNAALDAGGVVDRKRTLELFETPPEIAKRMAQIAAAVADRIERNILVLEPSAGRGRLLVAFAENLDTNGKDEVVAIEIDAENCAFLREQGIATRVIEGDFIGYRPCLEHCADVILMNPPFGQCADIAHVRHAFEAWLKPGGILVAIMSPHWVRSVDRASNDFRVMLSQLGDVLYDWEDLPAGSFKSEGTGVNVGMLTLRKPADFKPVTEQRHGRESIAHSYRGEGRNFVD